MNGEKPEQEHVFHGEHEREQSKPSVGLGIAGLGIVFEDCSCGEPWPCSVLSKAAEGL